jgi:hypothetical protein
MTDSKQPRPETRTFCDQLAPARVVAPISTIFFLQPLEIKLSGFDNFDRCIQTIHRLTVGEVLGNLERSEDAELPFWEETHDPKPEDLLPHVARYLSNRSRGHQFPSEADSRSLNLQSSQSNDEPSEGGAEESIDSATAECWRVAPAARRGLCLGTEHQGWLAHIAGSTLPFHWIDLRLYVFRAGIGFLVVEVIPHSPALADWMTFTHGFRFADGERGIRITYPESINKQLFGHNSENQEAPKSSRLRADCFQRILVELLRSTPFLYGLNPTSRHQYNFVPGRLIPFSVLYIEGISEKACRKHLMFFLRNVHPPTYDRKLTLNQVHWNQPSYLVREDGQYFYMASEGGGFVDFDSREDSFARQGLPNDLRRNYLLFYLIVRHQQLALMNLSSQVADRWLPARNLVSTSMVAQPEVATFIEIRDALLEFTARGMFSRVALYERHHHFYKRWQQVLEIEELYREVRDEIAMMDDCIRSQYDENVQQYHLERLREEAVLRDLQEQRNEQAIAFDHRVARLGMAFGVPSLLLAAAQVASFSGRTAHALAGGLLVGGLLAGYWLARSSTRKKELVGSPGDSDPNPKAHERDS